MESKHYFSPKDNLSPRPLYINCVTIHESPDVLFGISPFATSEFTQSTRQRERKLSLHIGPETDSPAAPVCVVGCRRVQGHDQSSL
jgi:hypothetical protein